MHGCITKKSILFFFFIIISISLYSEVFSFKYIKDSKQRVEAYINGKQYVNNQFVADYFQKYKTIKTIKDVIGDTATIQDEYYYYNSNVFITNQTLQINDNINIVYTKDSRGKMVITGSYSLPTLRNVPYFLDSDITPGYKWTVLATEVQDLFNDKVISIFPIEVRYEFLGYEKLNGADCAKFKYSYKIDITNSPQYKIDNRILRVIGESETIMYFDNINGTRVKEIYSRDYAFLINKSGYSTTYEFIDSGERIWYPIELMNKDKIVADLKNELDRNKIQDTEVKKDDKGVKLSIENLHFYPDSPELLPGEYERLQKIATLLKKYKDKGVMIIGHTTDKGTEEGRRNLSIERAKVIMDYLVQMNAININKSSYGGKGGTEPIADNSTEEGMKKNRRVEIYILEE
jgi:outer membrane protein OmpA-like peptidoglycan-associated protein